MKIRNFLAVLALAVAPVLAIAGSASASTSGCLTGTYSQYCGTETDQSPAALSLDVFQQGAHVNNKVIGYGNSADDKATDLLALAYQGDNTLGAFFEYAPNGVASNLCLSEPSQGAGVVLRFCNGLGWQRWVASPVYQVYDNTGKLLGYGTKLTGTESFSATAAVTATPKTPAGYIWTNVATKDVLTTNGPRAQITGVPDPTTLATPGLYTAAEAFNFAS